MLTVRVLKPKKVEEYRWQLLKLQWLLELLEKMVSWNEASLDCVSLEPLFTLAHHYSNMHTHIYPELKCKKPIQSSYLFAEIGRKTHVCGSAPSRPPLLDQSSCKVRAFLYLCSCLQCVDVSFHASGKWAWAGQLFWVAKFESVKESECLIVARYLICIC